MSPPVPAATRAHEQAKTRRRSAHFTPAAQAEAQSRWGEPLPQFLIQLVFVQHLPADARARAGSVCRAWAHALLTGPDAWRCWTALDLSHGSGLSLCVGYFELVTVLAGAAALARGRLQELSVNYYSRNVCRVMRDNSEHLRLLAVGNLDDNDCSMELFSLRQLLAEAGPALRTLQVRYISCNVDNADLLPLLRAEPPFSPVRVDSLTVHLSEEWRQYSAEEEEVLPRRRHGANMRPFADAVATTAVRMLCLTGVHDVEPPVLEVLAGALLAPECRVEKLRMSNGNGSHFLHVLARLLAGDGGALEEVHADASADLFNGASEEEMEAVCAALRRSTLTSVELCEVGLSSEQCGALREAAAAGPQLRDIYIVAGNVPPINEEYLPSDYLSSVDGDFWGSCDKEDAGEADNDGD